MSCITPKGLRSVFHCVLVFNLDGLYFVSCCQVLHQTSAVLILAIHKANVYLEYSTKQNHVVEKMEQFHK